MSGEYDPKAVSKAPISDDRLTSFKYRVKFQTTIRPEPFVVKFDDYEEAEQFAERAKKQAFWLGDNAVFIEPDKIDSVVIETPDRILVKPTKIKVFEQANREMRDA